jgi:hypothetical protein
MTLADNFVDVDVTGAIHKGQILNTPELLRYAYISKLVILGVFWEIRIKVEYRICGTYTVTLI